MLEVTLWYTGDNGGLAAASPIEVDFVSLYNTGSHGPPALVAPARDHGRSVAPVARVEDRVFYINTAFIPAFTIERLHDRA